MTTPTPQEKYTLLIVGSGIAGPALALTVLSHPILSSLYTPIIFDRLPSTHAYFAGAAVVLSSNALYPLIQLGLKDAVFQNSEEALSTTMWRSTIPTDTTTEVRAGKYLNKLKNPNWTQDLGTGLRTIERGVLMKILVDQVIKLGGEVVWDAKVVGYEQAPVGVEVILEDGARRTGHMVIGADGGWSTIRKQLMGKDVNWKPEFAGASGLYGISRRPVGPDEEILGHGHAVLLDNGGISTWALPGGRQFWCVSLPETSQPMEKSVTLTDGQYGNITTGGYSFESTEEILKRFEKAWYPVVGNCGAFFRDSEKIVRASLWQRVYEASEISNAESTEGGNVVVIGDAGRIMVPTSGQGACMSIEDATVLANALLNNPPTFASETQKPSFSTAFNEYTTLRTPRSKAIAKQAYWTGVVFMAERWWWRWIRDFFVGWIPMGNSPKEKAEKGEPIKDLNEWLYGVRLDVKMREEEHETTAP